MQTTLYTQGASTIDFDPSVPCLVISQVGFLTGEEFRQLQEKALELYMAKKKEHGKLASISNIIESDAIDMESLKWAAEDLAPRHYQAGNRYSAVILPEDEYALATMNAEIFMEESGKKTTEPHMETRMFKDIKSAKAWLEEVLKM